MIKIFISILWLHPSCLLAQVETNFSAGGAVRIGDSTTTCDASIEGAMRFDADGADTIDYCNGTTWLTLLTSSIGGDFKADGSVPMTGELELLSENSATDPDLTFNGDENTGLFQPAADEIAFSNAGTESLRIDASGNFGIGTNNPGQKLHVNSETVRFENRVLDNYPMDIQFDRYRAGPVNSSTSIALLNFRGADGSSLQRPAAQIEIAVDGTPGLNDMPGRMTFLTTPDNTMVPVERMRIDNQGNIGIGTTSPTALLDVYGDMISDTFKLRAPADANTGATYSIPDFNKSLRRLTLDNNTTVTLADSSSLATNEVFTLTLKFKQDATGSRTLAWAASGSDSIKWDGNSTPAPASGANEETIYQLTVIGGDGVWYASMIWREN